MTPIEILEKMARDVNNDLPHDLWNYAVKISMSKDGIFSTAIPLADMIKADDTETE